jgi:hypothetical protein
MSRAEALETLRGMAHGLPCDMSGCARLLERVAQTDEAEALRAALTEVGARTLLDNWQADV